MKIKTIVKTLFTVVTLIVAAFIFLVSVSIAGSSHNISAESRDNAMTRGFLAIGFSIALVVLIWIPWGEIIKRRS